MLTVCIRKRYHKNLRYEGTASQSNRQIHQNFHSSSCCDVRAESNLLLSGGIGIRKAEKTERKYLGKNEREKERKNEVPSEGFSGSTFPMPLGIKQEHFFFLSQWCSADRDKTWCHQMKEHRDSRLASGTIGDLPTLPISRVGSTIWKNTWREYSMPLNENMRMSSVQLDRRVWDFIFNCAANLHSIPVILVPSCSQVMFLDREGMGRRERFSHSCPWQLQEMAPAVSWHISHSFIVLC